MMKKALILTILIIFMMPNLAFSRSTPIKRAGMTENDYILDQMLPNPSVYLYGVDSNGFPLLLMNLSLTIPIYAIDDNILLRPFQVMGRYAPTFHKKIKSLKAITLYLKMNQSKISADGKYFYYKILKLQCDQEDQDVTYKDTSEWKLHGEGGYSQGGGSGKASVDRNMIRQMDYISKLPIRDYSGVGSDTLKIILKRGKKYPIRAGHMNISMVVSAIPYHKNPPLSYCALKNNNCNFDFVKEFMTSANPEAPCVPVIRKIYFSKTYTDNSMMNYYEVSPENNPNSLIIDSEVVMGNRINNCPIVNSYLNTVNRKFKTVEKTPVAVAAAAANETNNASNPKGKTKKAQTATCPKLSRSSEKLQTTVDNNVVQTIRSIEESKGLILEDGQFMYDNVFSKQIPNTESVTTGEDSSGKTKDSDSN